MCLLSNGEVNMGRLLMLLACSSAAPLSTGERSHTSSLEADTTAAAHGGAVSPSSRSTCPGHAPIKGNYTT